MNYMYVEPEVAGGLGDESIVDMNVHPWVVSKLDYEFHGWFGNPLLTAFPVFIVTEEAKEALISEQLRGMYFEDLVVSISDEFKFFFPNTVLPKFVWMKINGKAGTDDFGIAADHRLVISKQAFHVFSKLGNFDPMVEEFQVGK